MEPTTQVEIQLGHMCNNRCVFCVSGQETALGRARPLDVAPILERLDEAYAAGNRKVTLLGGEPTLQPGFMTVVQRAVDLGFEEIVVFTNGVKTARSKVIEDVVRTGGRFTWRISIQGADKTSHERTTRRPGSFDRIMRSMDHLQRLGQRITVNMCVVQSNYDSVDRFPELLEQFGVSQLHLDMVRPADAGERTDEDFREMIPRYSDMVGPLERMIDGFREGFDVNVGNLPFCVAPHLAPWIHHDGETTYTVAVDGDNRLSRPWNKYFVKRHDKAKPSSCARCVFDDRCNGIFEKYREIYGYDEFVPIDTATLAASDPQRRLFALHLKPILAELDQWSPPEPFDGVSTEIAGDREARVTLTGPEPLTLVLGEPGGGAASLDVFSVTIARLPEDRSHAARGLRALWRELERHGRVWHPLGDDAIAGEVTPAILKRLVRLRRSAPHAGVEWNRLTIHDDGHRAELDLAANDGSRATFWIADDGGKATAGYEIGAEPPSPGLVDGLRSVMSALVPPASGSPA